MDLTKEEEDALSGKSGESLASAYRILLAIGEATDAQRLVPVDWVHVSGVNYNTIGDSGVEFLKNFSQDSKVSVLTTINPMGFDGNKSHIPLSDNFIKNQTSIVESYKKMGMIPSFTCIPYEVFDVPPRGTAVSFAESNAAVFANSMLGLLTNKESALSALASAVTGKSPLSGLRNNANRVPRLSVIPEYKLENELDYGLLGYFAGKVVKDNVIAIDGIPPGLDMQSAKALSAGIGTSGSCGMFVQGQTEEKIKFGRKEVKSITDELDTSERGDIIAFGSPQLGLNELRLLADLTEGKKFKKRCMIFCARNVHEQATRIGLTGKIENSGAEFMCDSCTCLTPLISRNEYDSVITNSVKAAYYFNHSSGLGVCLDDMKSIVKEHAK